MKKIVLLIIVVFILCCAVSAQQRIKLTYVEFIIPLSSKEKATFEELSKFEAIPAFEKQNFQTLLEEGMKKKLIKVVTKESRVLDVEKTEILARQPDVIMTDKNGKFVDARPSFVFTVTPWIIGENDKSYINFDLVFQRNNIDKTIPVQNHLAWWGINFSQTGNSVIFNEVRQVGYRDNATNKYYGLALFFEKNN